jgi:hypothetical protein
MCPCRKSRFPIHGGTERDQNGSNVHLEFAYTSRRIERSRSWFVLS